MWTDGCDERGIKNIVSHRNHFIPFAEIKKSDKPFEVKNTI